MKSSSSPLRGKYLVRNTFGYIVLKILDCFSSMIAKRSIDADALPLNPRHILICNIAHLGDAVIATSLLPVIRDNFPHAKIGMLIGSGSQIVIQDHPAIQWIHHFDHWKINRASFNLIQKIKVHLSSFQKALKEIKKIKYDLAIDFNSCFPNSIYLLWRANIPHRIGYPSGGFGPLLTRSLIWKNVDQHTAYYHLDLLKLIPIQQASQQLAPSLPPIPEDTASLLEKKIPFLNLKSSGYIVCHMSAGLQLKEWPEKEWFHLAQELNKNYTLLFTGKGPREKAKISKIISPLKSYMDLSDQLNWQELNIIIKNASLLITSDSVAGHLASAYHTPCITIGHSINNIHHWKPLSKNNIFYVYPTPCAPCYSSTGCPSMDCISKINPIEILALVSRLIAPQKNNNEYAH